MDTATIYSCDDHLDLRAVPPGAVGVTPAERRRRARTARGRARRRVGLGVRGPRARRERQRRRDRRRSEEPQRDRPRRHRRRRLPRRDARAAARRTWTATAWRRRSIYGPLALGLPIDDPALQAACYAAWNDWAVEEFNAVAPDRLCACSRSCPATRPRPRPPSSSAARRSGTAARSSTSSTSTSATRRGTGCGRPPRHTGLPISFHIKGGSSSALSYQMGKWQSAAFATVLPLQLDEPLATMMFCGALERHPGLTLVLAESGVGWLPYFLARADLEWHAFATRSTTSPSIPPSELFRRQVMATFEEDALGAELIPLLGADSCMWASDYPHTDSTFPELAAGDRGDARRALRRRPPQGHRDQLRRALRLRARVVSRAATASSRLRPRRRSRCSDADAMVAFYRALGFDVAETPHLVVVHVGDQMINFHRAEMWQRDDFTLRAPARDAAVRRPLLRVGAERPDAARGDARRRGRRRRRRPGAAARCAWRGRDRACTCATPTATCSSS